MKAHLSWITPRTRPEDDVQLADEGDSGTWWAQIDVTLTALAATRLRRGEPVEVAGLPAGVTGELTRTRLTRATLRLTAGDPDLVFDALVKVDGDAAQRLHAHARAGGMQ